MGRSRRFVELSGLSVLLLAAGQPLFSQQVNTTSSAAVVGSQTPLPASIPVLAPPMVALPGSGTPVGAPVQVGVNDPRNGSGYVEQTGIAGTPEGYIVSTPMVSVPGTAANQSSANAAANTPQAGSNSNVQSGDQGPAGWRSGIGNFAADNGDSRRGSTATTIADAAAQFKARKSSSHPRQITNQDIYALKSAASNNGNGIGNFDTNAGSMPQSDVPGDATATGSSQGVLDQRDLDKVNAALARSRARQAAKAKEQSNQPSQRDNGTQPEAPKP